MPHERPNAGSFQGVFEEGRRTGGRHPDDSVGLPTIRVRTGTGAARPSVPRPFMEAGGYGWIRTENAPRLSSRPLSFTPR